MICAKRLDTIVSYSMIISCDLIFSGQSNAFTAFVFCMRTIIAIGEDLSNRTTCATWTVPTTAALRLRLAVCTEPKPRGRVESGIRCVRGNLWAGLRFVDLNDLNQQAMDC